MWAVASASRLLHWQTVAPLGEAGSKHFQLSVSWWFWPPARHHQMQGDKGAGWCGQWAQELVGMHVVLTNET